MTNRRHLAWRESTMRSRPVLAVVALAVGVASLAWAPSSLAAGVDVVGTFVPTVTDPAYAAPTPYIDTLRLAAEPTGRVLYTLDSQAPAFVAAYDLDSLKPVSRRGVKAGGAVSAWLSDPDRPQLLLAAGEAPTGGATTALQAVSVRAGRPTVVGTLPLSATDLGGPRRTVVGIGRQAGSPYAYLLSAVSDGNLGFAPRTTSLTLVDLTELTAGRAKVLGTAALPDCSVPLKSTDAGSLAAVGYARSTRSVYFGCSSAAQYVENVKPPVPTGVGRVSVAPATRGGAPRLGAFELYGFPGNVSGGGIWDSGGERLLLQTLGNSTRTVYTFDARDASYVGGVGLKTYALASMGVDDVHGRVYSLGGGGAEELRAADTRATPVDQGRSYPAFAKWQTHNPVPGSTIVVDSRTGRLWLPYRGTFVVAKDTVAYFRPPTAPDPDLATIDRPETPGRTGADFTAAAQAYGAIYRQVGGTKNLQYNLVPIEPTVAPVGDGTRELSIGYLDRLSLDNDTATASAIAADRDKANTQADEQRLPAGSPGWPYRQASCGDFGGSPKTGAADGAVVRCDAARFEATSSAVGDPSSVSPAGSAAPVIAVGDSGFTASARRTLAAGVTSTVTAQAQGISVLGGLLRVGDVQVVAEAHAHGRPGTAGTTFKRLIRRVELAGAPLCDDECDPDQIATTVNAAFPGRLRIDFPVPEPGPAKGSPGGFQAIVQRGLGEQLEAVQLNQQPKNRLEVPGMIVTVYQDNTTPSRTIAYLAGAAAEARYGIYELSQERPAPGAPDASPGGSQPALLALPVAAAPPTDGGAAAVGVTAAPPTADQPGATGITGSVAAGLRVLVNSAGRALGLLAVWAVLLIPVYLSARRWLMLRRGTLDEGTP